jgi:hypothetical protein
MTTASRTFELPTAGRRSAHLVHGPHPLPARASALSADINDDSTANTPLAWTRSRLTGTRTVRRGP